MCVCDAVMIYYFLYFRRRVAFKNKKDEEEKGGDKKEEGKDGEGEGEKGEEAKEEEKKQDEESKEKKQPEAQPLVKKRQALSPAVAECQRAIFAAFLWQSGLAHDAMASALYLKFHPDVTKEGGALTSETTPPSESNEVQKKDEKLPPTLHHLMTFWDEISQKVIDSSNASFSPPKVPEFASELMKRYEEEKKEMERLKKEKEKKSGISAEGGGAGGGGSTKCELCDAVFPDPVTYHMKEVHPGCGKHANGWGYNSRGSYCSGWAGNCGDGGRGGSTWYLLCKDCHAKYLSQKEENKRKVTKPVTVPKMKTRKPGKPRTLPVMPSVQIMIQNAKFLLEVASSGDTQQKVKSTSTVVPPSGDLSRQASTPEESKGQSSKEAPLLSYARPKGPPVLARSISMATGEPQVKRTFSDSGEELAPPTISRQFTHIPESDSTSSSETSSLVTRPSMSLANLMYRRSCSTSESGYDKLMSFVTSYHDLSGLKVTMKQMMRIAGLRATALEVK